MANLSNAIVPSLPAQTKGQRIFAARQRTREKRKTQAVFIAKVKIVESALSNKQKEALHRVFLEAKWFKNSMVAFSKNNKDKKISDFDTKNTTVSVRMGRDSDEYEERKFSVLSSSARQKIGDLFKNNIKTLSTQKKNGRKVGSIDYVKEMSSVPLRQYGTDYEILSTHYVKVTKIGKVRVRGLLQIPQDADIANADLIHKPDGYYLHITTYLPVIYNPVVASRSDVGIDFGITSSFTTSDGETFNSFIPETSRLKRLQRGLARKEKGSNNWLKTLFKIKREYQTMDNRKEEAANQLVHYLLSNYRIIYMQDENITGWKRMFGKKVHHSILGRVKKKLINHPRVVVLKRSAATTQFCPECHALNKMPLNKRTYKCTCGYTCDRDIHAAQNMITMVHCSPRLIKKDMEKEKVGVERTDYTCLPQHSYGAALERAKANNRRDGCLLTA